MCRKTVGYSPLHTQVSPRTLKSDGPEQPAPDGSSVTNLAVKPGDTLAKSHIALSQQVRTPKVMLTQTEADRVISRQGIPMDTEAHCEDRLFHCLG